MSDSARNQQVDEAIAAYLQAEEAGTPLDREAFLEAHPELRSELESFLSARLMLQRRAPLDEDATIPPSSSPVATGDVVRYFGDYEVIEELARGGMGVVFRARQVSLNRVVALKMILSGSLAGADDVARFRSEAEAAANLDHPNICPIYEVGEHQGQQYYSMKLIAGGSLAGRVATLVQQPREAAELLAKVADAVHHAHVRGILHRDLKPANVLLDEAGVPYVTDFGLARRVEGDSGLTQTGAIVGTPSYMAPEQASARKDLTTGVDVYALGAILYECLTGQPPFTGPSPLDVVLQVIDRAPVPPGQINARVPRDLETICLKCLEKEPGRRYESAAALAEELRRWLRGEPIVARPAGNVERAWRWARRNPVVAGLSAAVFMALVGLAAMGWVVARSADKAVLAERDRVTVAEQREQDSKEHVKALAIAADKEKLRLRQALLEQARAERIAGDRWRALELLNEAVQIKPGDDLRQEVILALATPGLRLVAEEVENDSAPSFRVVAWPSKPNGLQFGKVGDFHSLGVIRRSNDPFRISVRSKVSGLREIAFGRLATPRSLLLPPPQLPKTPQRTSSDGTWLAYRDETQPDSVNVWCATRGRRFARLTGTTGVMMSPRNDDAKDGFAPSGAVLALTQWEQGMASLRVYETATGRILFAARHVVPSRWSEDGRFLLTTGLEQLPRRRARSKAKDPDERVKFIEQEFFVLDEGLEIPVSCHHLWELAHTVPACRIDEAVTRLTFSSDGQRLIVNSSLWRLGKSRELCPLPPELPGGSLGFVGQETWGITPYRRRNRIPDFLNRDLLTWHAAEGCQTVALMAGWVGQGPVAMATVLATNRIRANRSARLHRFSPEVRCWEVHGDGMAAIREEVEKIRRFPGVKTAHDLHHTDVREQVWAPNGENVASLIDLVMTDVGKGQVTGVHGVLELLNCRTSQRVWVKLGRRLPDSPEVPWQIAWSPDGSLVAVPEVVGVMLRDAITGQVRKRVGNSTYDRLAWSRDGKLLLATGTSDEYTRVFDTTTGKELASRPPDPGNWLCFAFSPDGRWIVRSGEDRYLRIEDSHTGKLLVRWQAHDAAITALAFSPDGKTLVTGGRDGLVRAWPIPYLREELAKLGLDWE